MPAGTPVVAQISPSTITRGTSATYTITGTNTNFVQGTTVLSPIPGVTVGMTVKLKAASNAVTQTFDSGNYGYGRGGAAEWAAA